MRNILLLCAVLAASPALEAQLLINEIGTGSPDYIEIINAGQDPFDLRGHTVFSYETRGNSSPCSPPPAGQFGLVTQWAFSPTQSFMLAPGAVLVLMERGTAGQQPSPEVLETGQNIYFHESSDCEVWIERPGGTVVDYVVFGSVVLEELVQSTHAATFHWRDTPVIRPRRGGWVVARINTPLVPDTNEAADWIVDDASGQSPGQRNPNTPTGIGAFGMGDGSPGTCSALGETNYATAVPTLTWQDFTTGAPVLGGQLQLSVSSGLPGGPLADALILSSTLTPPVELCPKGPELLLQPPWIVLPTGASYDGLGAGDLPDIPIPSRPRLGGLPLYAQVFFVQPLGGGTCALRATQGLQILLR